MTSNNLASIMTEVGGFQIEQRNVGFADNDGQWIVHQNAELYWSGTGTLYEKRPSKFLGVFPNRDAVDAAIASAQVQPEHTPYHKALN